MTIRLPPRLIGAALTMVGMLVGLQILPRVFDISPYAGLFLGFAGTMSAWSLMLAHRWVPALPGWPHSARAGAAWAFGLAAIGGGILLQGAPRILLLAAGAAIAATGWLIDRAAAGATAAQGAFPDPRTPHVKR